MYLVNSPFQIFNCMVRSSRSKWGHYCINQNMYLKDESQSRRGVTIVSTRMFNFMMRSHRPEKVSTVSTRIFTCMRRSPRPEEGSLRYQPELCVGRCSQSKEQGILKVKLFLLWKCLLFLLRFFFKLIFFIIV